MSLVQEPSADTQYFFVHVMKVGGYSLVDMLVRDQFREMRERYPNREDGNDLGAAIDYETLKRAIQERGNEIRFYCGHFPYAAVKHMGENVKTLALFRDPVERCISHIRHLKPRSFYRELTPEEIYASRNSFNAWFDNLQLRYFAVPNIETGKSLFETTPLTEADVEVALENVRNVDVIGLTEEFEDFIGMLQVQFGWRFGDISRINKSLKFKIPPALRERISADLVLDKKFYEGVRQIYEERKRALIAKHGPLLQVANS